MVALPNAMVDVRLGCYSHWFCFAGIGLIRGQYAVRRMRAPRVVVGQPFADPGESARSSVYE